VVVIAFEFLAGGFARPQHPGKAKAGQMRCGPQLPGNFELGEKVWRFTLNIWARRRKMRRKIAMLQVRAWLWLDSETDRRYERPMFEDARVSTQRTVARAKNYA
jgi:hypothetical protein